MRVLPTLRVYPALMRAYFARALVYRAELFIWMITSTMPLVFMSIWITIAGDKGVNGFQVNDFVSYYLAFLVVRRATQCWQIHDYEVLIRQGELSPLLLRPLGVPHYFAARLLPVRAIQLIMLFILIAPVVLLIPGRQFDTTLPNLLTVAAFCCIGWVIQFLIQYAIGALAFWITQVTTVSEVVFFVQSFLGGFVVPMVLLPPQWVSILRWLPFHLPGGLPAQILAGQATVAQIQQGAFVAVIWVVILAAFSTWLWSRGIKGYSAVGA